MDRFIGPTVSSKSHSHSCLKSNMDRFIVLISLCIKKINLSLKSNMDRFIVKTITTAKAKIIV